MRIFVSYAHKQGDWVRDRLVPILRASGAEVLVDVDRFTAGKAVIGQMDDLQGKAQRHVLVITGDYVASDYCRHEMTQAIATDADFSNGKVIVIRRDDEALPNELDGKAGLGSEPLYVDLRDDNANSSWELLLKSFDHLPLGVDAPRWLSAIQATHRHLERGESVNLVVGAAVQWQTFQQQLIEARSNRLGVVDLRKPGTIPREGFVEEVLKATSGPLASPVPASPHDLPLLAEKLLNGGPYHLLLSHFDLINAPERQHYTDELARSLRWSCMDDRSLVLVVQTRTPVANVLPANEFDSWPDFKTVELG